MSGENINERGKGRSQNNWTENKGFIKKNEESIKNENGAEETKKLLIIEIMKVLEGTSIKELVDVNIIEGYTTEELEDYLEAVKEIIKTENASNEKKRSVIKKITYWYKNNIKTINENPEIAVVGGAVGFVVGATFLYVLSALGQSEELFKEGVRISNNEGALKWLMDAVTHQEHGDYGEAMLYNQLWIDSVLILGTIMGAWISAVKAEVIVKISEKIEKLFSKKK